MKTEFHSEFPIEHIDPLGQGVSRQEGVVTFIKKTLPGEIVNAAVFSQKKGVQFAEVCLHVGLGTFLPVKTERVEDHTMHSEWVEVPDEAVELINQAKREGRRIVAVGTTTARTLEGVAALSAEPDGELFSYSGDINLFITPGFQFHLVDALIAKRIKVYVVDDLSSGQKSNVNPNATFTKLSVNAPAFVDYLKKVKPDVIFHLAAQINVRKSVENPVDDAKTNIMGLLAILSVAKEIGVKKLQ